MKYNQAQSGFSLVETLVAITILLIVIVGPMTIMSTASNSASFASDQVIAFFLAQEGAELAQKARDDIVLNRFLSSSDPQYGTRYDPDPWTTFINGSTYQECFASGCGLEISEVDGAIETPQNCATASNCDLYYDDSTSNVRSRYTHNQTGTDETPYRRIIRFETVGAANEVRVVSTVEWFSGRTRNAQSVEVETFLIDVYAP